MSQSGQQGPRNTYRVQTLSGARMVVGMDEHTAPPLSPEAQWTNSEILPRDMWLLPLV